MPDRSWRSYLMIFENLDKVSGADFVSLSKDVFNLVIISIAVHYCGLQR
jgi:hypothetical protein